MGVAVVALIAYTAAIQLGVYGFMGWAVDDTVKRYGGPAVPRPVYALVAIGIIAVLGYRHIDVSAKVLGVASILEVGVVLVLDLVILATVALRASTCSRSRRPRSCPARWVSRCCSR